MVRSLTVVAGDRRAAEDAVQDAFERAYVRWRKVSRYDQPVAWIRRVAINRLHDRARREKRKRRAIEHLADTAATSTELDHSVELSDVLADLPKQQRTAMALFYVEGLPVADVAEAMGLSAGAVKYHLHEGRERLRPLLGVEAEGRGA
jgi:RNA polymerase sigma-70 factor (ECF subfamily)